MPQHEKNRGREQSGRNSGSTGKSAQARPTKPAQRPQSGKTDKR